MAGDPKIVVLFRTTEQKNKNKKNKPEWVTNVNALKSLYSDNGFLGSSVRKSVIFGDRLEDPLALEHFGEIKEITRHGNSESFLEVLDYALTLPPDTIVYFLEDDYIHAPGWFSVLQEGLERAHYVSLYDHPDKYTGNPEVLFHTKSCHWKYTHSTTMTFAVKVSTLAYDAHVFKEMITTGTPPDHEVFLQLQRMGRRLATPIPGFATHGETAWLAPVRNWEDYV